MPYPNEHSCRLADPGQFVRCRRNNDVDPNVIVCWRKDGSSEPQAFRYPKDKWSVERARAHCSEHKGTFEPASESASSKTDEVAVLLQRSMPTPHAGEEQREYIERCMSDMKEDIPDTDARVAACMRTWRESRSSEGCYTRFTFSVSDVAVGRPDQDSADMEKKGRKLVGHAAVFNRLSEDRGGFCYVIAPGAFANSVAQDDVRALFNHDTNLILGRTSNGTLRLAEDEEGLRIEIDLPDTQCGRDLAALVERRDVTQMSFGGSIEQVTHHEDDELEIHAIRVFKLWDISPVTFPAFDGTSLKIVAATDLPALTVAEPPPKAMFDRLKKARAWLVAQGGKPR